MTSPYKFKILTFDNHLKTNQMMLSSRQNQSQNIHNQQNVYNFQLKSSIKQRNQQFLSISSYFNNVRILNKTVQTQSVKLLNKKQIILLNNEKNISKTKKLPLNQSKMNNQLVSKSNKKLQQNVKNYNNMKNKKQTQQLQQQKYINKNTNSILNKCSSMPQSLHLHFKNNDSNKKINTMDHHPTNPTSSHIHSSTNKFYSFKLIREQKCRQNHEQLKIIKSAKIMTNSSQKHGQNLNQSYKKQVYSEQKDILDTSYTEKPNNNVNNVNNDQSNQITNKYQNNKTISTLFPSPSTKRKLIIQHLDQVQTIISHNSPRQSLSSLLGSDCLKIEQSIIIRGGNMWEIN